MRSVGAKVLGAIYPLCTVFVIVSTANHYFIDAIGGFTILTVGYVLARLFTRAGAAPSSPSGGTSSIEATG